MTTLTPVDDVLAELLARCRPCGRETVALGDASTRVLADDLRSALDVPSFVNSAMDGYAVRSADAAAPGTELRVVGTSTAGHPADVAVGAGEAVRIMTGAVLPDGADAVCVLEATAPGREAGLVRLEVGLRAGEHVRRPGEDVRKGALVLRAGAVLTPARIGIAAAVGAERLEVVARPRVGVLSTGDELSTDALSPGMIHDSNRPALLAAAAEAGAEAVDLGTVRDDLSSLVAAIERASRTCDLVVMSGGVSVGDADFGHAVLGELCAGTARSLSLAVKPGKPFAYGLVGGSGPMVVGLPGNPVSALVSFEVLVRPVVLSMGGRSEIRRPRVLAVADQPLERHPDGKVHLVRVVVTVDGDGAPHVEATSGQASHHLGALADADGLAILPDGKGVVAGDLVATLLLRAEAPLGPFASARLAPEATDGGAS